MRGRARVREEGGGGGGRERERFRKRHRVHMWRICVFACCVCMFVYMCARIRFCACMYACSYRSMHAYVRAHLPYTYACMHACIFLKISNRPPHTQDFLSHPPTHPLSHPTPLSHLHSSRIPLQKLPIRVVARVRTAISTVTW